MLFNFQWLSSEVLKKVGATSIVRKCLANAIRRPKRFGASPAEVFLGEKSDNDATPPLIGALCGSMCKGSRLQTLCLGAM